MAKGRGVILHSPLYRGVAEGRVVILPYIRVTMMSPRWGYCVCTPSGAEGYIYTSDSRLGFARRAVSAEVCTPSEAEGNRMNERIEEWIMNESNYK